MNPTPVERLVPRIDDVLSWLIYPVLVEISKACMDEALNCMIYASPDEMLFA